MATIEETPVVDGDKLMAFVFNAVDEVGAALNAALVVIGDGSASYRAMAGAGAAHVRRARRAHRHRRALRARVAERPGGRRLRRVRPGDRRYTLPPEQAVALADEESPAFLPGASSSRSARCSTRRASPTPFRAAPASAGTSTTTTSSRAASASSGPATTRTSSPRGSRRSTASWRSSSAARPVADVGCGHGASTILMAQAFPKSTFVGFDYHAASIEAARARAREAGVADRVRFEVAAAADLSGRRLRPRRLVRLPARHGRPGRRGAPRRSAARTGRHVDDRRAVRRRPRRGQPQPGRPRLLRGLDAALHAGLALAGGRPRARRAGRRGAHPRRRHGRRLHPLPPRRRDAVQPRLRGAGSEPGHRRAARASRARASPTRRATSSATACGCTTRSTGAASRRSCSCRRWSIIHSRIWKAQVALPRPPFPRGRLRRPRERQVRPPATAPRLAARGGRGGRARRHGRRGTETAVLVALSRGAWPSLRSPPSTRSACRLSARAGRPPSTPPHPWRAAAPRRRARAQRSARAGRGRTAQSWQRRLRGLPASSSSARCSRAALDQADRGRRRLGLPDRVEALVEEDARRRLEGGGRRGAPPARALPDAGRSTATRQRHAAPRRPALAELTGGDGRAGRRRAPSPWPRPGEGQPAAARLRRARSAPPAPRRRACGAAGGGARCSCPRRSGSATPGATSRSRRSCAKLHPGLEIDWLAQDPVTTRARGAGRAHPPGQRRARQRGGAHRVRVRRARAPRLPDAAPDGRDPAARTSWSSTTSCSDERYDLWIGDEAWEVDYFLHENPELKRAPYAWLTDFVGWLPMPEGGEREAFLAADYNARDGRAHRRYPRVRDRAIFIGNPDDVVAEPLRPGPPRDPRLDREHSTSPAT